MLEGYLLQNIVIMSYLKNWFTLTVVFNSLISPFKRMLLLCVFLFFLQHGQNKYSHLFWICGVFQVWALFASVKASGWPWPQCPGLNRSQMAQTSSPSLRQLPPGVIVVTTNDWQPPGCQSKCDLLRPHCVEKWFEPQNELWIFFPSNITITITWNTGHMMEMNAFVTWLIKTEKCWERQWRKTVTNAGWM